jgi:hypothetical protein
MNKQSRALRCRCSACRGRLLLAAYIKASLGYPAERIFRCCKCDHLEWFEEPVLTSRSKWPVRIGNGSDAVSCPSALQGVAR